MASPNVPLGPATQGQAARYGRLRNPEALDRLAAAALEAAIRDPDREAKKQGAVILTSSAWTPGWTCSMAARPAGEPPMRFSRRSMCAYWMCAYDGVMPSLETHGIRVAREETGW